ncbi:ASI1-immunoprecipitated protein 1-like isoform X2 [Aristolochia californica]|uniref:ASI1-immunoprecipitated protein 1-like isoform X2 n=1 Tax=Aristolochia californica TaxID=171875 RepID=UPI0035E3988F
MGMALNKEYTEFEEKVRRTVYLDNLGPQVTNSVLKTALGQFGNVISAQLIPNYMDSMDGQQFALVEMETQKQARAVIAEMAAFPFMMSGMPRPVRARPAETEMFCDRPVKPGRKIHCRWLEPTDPDFEVAQKLKDLTKQHAAEASVLLKEISEQK